MPKQHGKVVAAVGTASAGKAETGKAIADAMAAAIEQAYADGITDPEKIKALQLAARERVKAKARA